MRAETRTVQLGVIKIVLTIAAIMLFTPLLLIIADPLFSWCESAGTGRGIVMIGWIPDAAIRVLAISIVSFVVGLLFPRDRWVARLAATISVLWILIYDTLAVVYLVNRGEPQVASALVRSWMMPLACVGVIVFLCSPLFHDCGRILRSYLPHRRGKNGGASQGPPSN